MRRLPIYFLIDVSESMIGEPIEQVQDGISSIIQELRTDPYALETAFISIIAFAGKAKTLVPLTELFKFRAPTFPIGGGTSLGHAMDFLMKDIDFSVQKTTTDIKGDWKPIVFLFTDGSPTDNPTRSFQKWNEKYRNKCNLIAISIGDNADTQVLGKITDNVLRLKDTDRSSFKQFFKWITASIKTSSVSVIESYSDELKLAPIDGINLEKVNHNICSKVDEKFAIIMSKCQNTKQPYLIKYEKKLNDPKLKLNNNNGDDIDGFKLIGAFPINDESYKSLSDNSSINKNINTIELHGVPICPCCGNPFDVVCVCGNIFCANNESINTCPWCGITGNKLTKDKGSNINRNIG